MRMRPKNRYRLDLDAKLVGEIVEAELTSFGRLLPRQTSELIGDLVGLLVEKGVLTAEDCETLLPDYEVCG
jgi:hypothetical protein